MADEAQFQFGNRRDCVLEMVFSEESLEELVKTSTAALEKMRAEAEDLERTGSDAETDPVNTGAAPRTA
ncbi:hypothetical protein [Amycolatopsis cihanbeyliensis]|uniref:hypothetical protein n=1 Tax=Amycolatopsis cihanbeyliensis TaxID=1128664 RepID=UPI0011534961|nr:hypothetical protein [Amycolatopsis cihanbeyliensis]